MNERDNGAKASEDILKEGVDYVVRDRLRIDAKEFDPKYKKIMKKVDLDSEKGVRGVDLFWFDIWRNKKRMLKDRYGLEWRSLAELNADVYFD